MIEHPEDVAEAISYLRGHDIVGFDTETKPNFKKGMTNRVSLIQVSTEDRSFLFRLNKMGFTPELREFMECEDVLKVGLSLKDDFHVLHKAGEFEPRNFVDLQNMVKKYHISDSSLQKYMPYSSTDAYPKANASPTGRHQNFPEHRWCMLRLTHGHACAFTNICCQENSILQNPPI